MAEQSSGRRIIRRLGRALRWLGGTCADGLEITGIASCMMFPVPPHIPFARLRDLAPPPDEPDLLGPPPGHPERLPGGTDGLPGDRAQVAELEKMMRYVADHDG